MSATVQPQRTGGDDTAAAGRTSLLIGAVIVMLAGAFAAGLVATQEPLLVAPLVGALVGLVVFARPVAGVYLLFGAAMLLEQFEISGLTPLTAQTHFYENLSTWSAVPIRLSLSDLLAILTLVSWGLRRLVRSNEPARGGPYAWAVGGYALVWLMGAVIGAAHGGGWDLIVTLAESRGGLYFCLLYFLTTNLIRERAQLVVLLWEFVLIVGVKAIQGIGNYQVILDLSYQVEAVTAHEDVVFFDAAIALALVMLVLRVRAKLTYALLALLPVILTTEMLTQRRSAFAALAAVLALVVIMSAVERPRLTMIVLGATLFLSTGYAAAFWNSGSRLAEPVRLIKEVADPASVSARDRSSDAWREIENSNIAFTIRQLPLTGVGLGQQYLFEREPPALTNFVYWRYIAHNALLWLWLKAGPYGAFAFWFLIAQIVMRGLRLYRRLDDPFLRSAAAFPVLLAVAQVVFSSVDLGLSYNRTMSVFGIAVGLAASLGGWASARTIEPRRGPPIVSGGADRVAHRPWIPVPAGPIS